jgi:hypothetical protein
MAGRVCESCNSNIEKVAPRTRDGVTVWLGDACFADWFRRERAFARARGEKWDPAVAGRPTR